jgi:tRNA A37 threonylcarbamoyladenosine biosynthesis protein TsaE
MHGPRQVRGRHPKVYHLSDVEVCKFKVYPIGNERQLLSRGSRHFLDVNTLKVFEWRLTVNGRLL